VLNKYQSNRLGEANILFAGQRHQEALAILKDLIRDSPECFEPWLTVGTIYESIGELAKSQGALFMAAYLNERDDSLWMKLADQSLLVHFSGSLTF
jgi:hypothetical protein